MKYYIGIDIGGTQIKGGIIDNNFNILFTKTINTNSELGNDIILLNIINLINDLKYQAKILLNISEFSGLGIGVPGIIDIGKGMILTAYNLNFNNYPIVKKLKEFINLPIKIINDANAATLAELYVGSGKGNKNLIMLTLGTGVGGGVIINNHLYVGNCGAGAELGHTVIIHNGKKCSCGRNGCVEQYISATALKKATVEAISSNPKSKMSEIPLSEISSKTPFMYMNIDKTANQIIQDYINILATELTNLANIFRPETIILGGGVSNQGEILISPLQKIVDKNVFANNKTPKVKIKTAKLGNDAGILGAVINFLLT